MEDNCLEDTGSLNQNPHDGSVLEDERIFRSGTRRRSRTRRLGLGSVDLFRGGLRFQRWDWYMPTWFEGSTSAYMTIGRVWEPASNQTSTILYPRYPMLSSSNITCSSTATGLGDVRVQRVCPITTKQSVKDDHYFLERVFTHHQRPPLLAVTDMGKFRKSYAHNFADNTLNTIKHYFFWYIVYRFIYLYSILVVHPSTFPVPKMPATVQERPQCSSSPSRPLHAPVPSRPSLRSHGVTRISHRGEETRVARSNWAALHLTEAQGDPGRVATRPPFEASAHGTCS